jgi:hypothetical protein
MTVLAFAPMHNTKVRKDATGAFQPEAQAFCKMHGGRLVLVDNQKTAAEMRSAVIREVTLEPQQVTWERLVVAFFCHGSRNGIQFGFTRASVDPLATSIAAKSSEVVVPLYACLAAGPATDAAGGDGGFADTLRDALCAAGSTWCRVDAHATAGHTTWNPYVRRFEGVGTKTGGCGGQYIVAPGSKLWPKWRKALRETNLRLRFPTLTIEDIHQQLTSR